MQSDVPTREQLRSQLAAIGIELDDARLEMLLPAYAGVLGGARRLAALDLGDAEPAMIYRHPRRSEAGS